MLNYLRSVHRKEKFVTDMEGTPAMLRKMRADSELNSSTSSNNNNNNNNYDMNNNSVNVHSHLNNSFGWSHGRYEILVHFFKFGINHLVFV